MTTKDDFFSVSDSNGAYGTYLWWVLWSISVVLMNMVITAVPDLMNTAVLRGVVMVIVPLSSISGYFGELHACMFCFVLSFCSCDGYDEYCCGTECCLQDYHYDYGFWNIWYFWWVTWLPQCKLFKQLNLILLEYTSKDKGKIWNEIGNIYCIIIRYID